MPPTIKETIEFIHSKGGMENWSDAQIEEIILRSIKQCAFTFTLDAENKLESIFIGKWNIPTISLHAVYCTGKVKVFLKYLRSIYPTCHSLTRFNKGKFKTHHI